MRTVEKADFGKEIGNLFLVVSIDERSEQVAKLREVDDKTGSMFYEMMSGIEKGETYEGRFEAAAPIFVYDPDELEMALLDCKVDKD